MVPSGVILRSAIKNSVEAALQRSRVVALVGPRQCGKTTIAREFVPVNSANYFDLEDPVSLARLEDPKVSETEFQASGFPFLGQP